MKRCIIWALPFKDEMRKVLIPLFENSIFDMQIISEDDIVAYILQWQVPDALILNYEYFRKNLESWLFIKEYAYGLNIPLIFIGSKKDPGEEFRALELGADDFLSIEMSPRLCQSRIKAKTRQMSSADFQNPLIVRAGKLELDLKRSLVRINNVKVRLTPLEFTVLNNLIKKQGKIVSIEELIFNHGQNRKLSPRKMKYAVHQIRRKIYPLSHMYIQTIWGQGYRLGIS